jgi:AmpD protein
LEKPINSSLQHNLLTGLVSGARQIPSPNHDERPAETKINVLVIHAISLPPQCYGQAFVEDYFTNRLDRDVHPYFMDIADRTVSSHFYIRRGGEIIQFVPTLLRAWHAGESSFHGREGVNDFSIGVELEGCDEHEFEDVQYGTLSSLTKCLQIDFPLITRDRIVGHSDVSPGRKTDPGPFFKWDKYFSALETPET